MQVIVTGDFFQLPPVTKGNAPTKFAFEANLWNQTIKRTFNLTKVFRQRDEGAFFFAFSHAVIVIFIFNGSREMVSLTILVAGVVYSARIRGYAERDAVREAVA